MSDTSSMTKDEITQAVAAIPYWFHSIELDQGVVTPGHKTPEILRKELKSLRLPDLRGKTVLDIGAWDGFYTWTAERLGAGRVVSLDHFAWSLNRPKAMELQSLWRETGTGPIPFEETVAWEPAVLPGKRGYDLAHNVLNSNAECHVGNFMGIDYDALGGPFDVVLWLGVLYHMRNPLLALQQVAEATREVAIIETEAFTSTCFADHALCKFLERDELWDDFTNWWVPTEKALVDLCRAAGFRQVEVVQGAPRLTQRRSPPEAKTAFQKVRRAGGHVLREFNVLPPSAGPPIPRIEHYRAIAHAWK